MNPGGWRFPLRVGFRYASSTHRGALVAFISRVSTAGLVLGVALLIVVLSVMNGFDRELRERILSLVPHVSLQPIQPVRDWRALVAAVEAHPEVLAAAPYVDLQALLMYRGKVVPALIHGTEPAFERRISSIDRYLAKGTLDLLDADADTLLLSDTLAHKLGVGVGESLQVMVPDVNAVGQVMPRVQRVLLGGVFDTGTEVDNAMALAGLGLATRLRGAPGVVQGVRFQVRDLFSAPRVEREVIQGLGIEIHGLDWTRTHGNLYEAIQLSRNMVGILLFLIIAVAVFNVVSTLFLIVKDKEGDIAILRTLGASPADIMGVFMVQGTLIGLAGALCGGLIGCVLSLLITDAVALLESLLGVQFLKAEVYPVSYLPSQLAFTDVASVCAVALAMSFVATLYPSWRAARMQPAEVLRYE
ncbi:MAG: lipoprotein-releasing ABC transporter permease subunit [Gammaproteobacteria bacterium]|nr:lipoprotein-releasing ABC transporter permease subunit [Gammaproteobacteria bacterium]